MPIMENLKPCPFCGGRAYMWEYTNGVRIDCENWSVVMNKEHFVGVGAKTKDEAIALWNREGLQNG